ncbi:hypothetical protein C8R44DRAFT_741946 [Mycena epipterygia]|nr:hypothetical protein C8R44DRAFT_741946 [Mycena epipterygia]
MTLLLAFIVYFLVLSDISVFGQVRDESHMAEEKKSLAAPSSCPSRWWNMSLLSGIDASDHHWSQSLSQPFPSLYPDRGADDENCPPEMEYHNLYQIPNGTQRNPSHNQLTDDGVGDFGETPGSGILGRRKRTESLADWSPPTKARLTSYAEDIATEYGVPESSREEFINAIMFWDIEGMIPAMQGYKPILYLQSSSADTDRRSQDNVIGQVRGVLMDPKLSSYKTGFLDRLLRHMRLNPAAYQIPQEFRAMITTKAFNSAMTTAWASRTTIYDLVKLLAWKSSQEMTDAIWARFAWVMKLVDYKTEGGKDDGYWDYIDKLLAERRTKALTIQVENRAAFSSFVFEEALKLHMTHCKAKTRRSSTHLPKWQQDISRAVAEMESYTVEDLAEEELQGNDENEDGETHSPDTTLASGSGSPPDSS